jgi:hypothetical protein
MVNTYNKGSKTLIRKTQTVMPPPEEGTAIRLLQKHTKAQKVLQLLMLKKGWQHSFKESINS